MKEKGRVCSLHFLAWKNRARTKKSAETRDTKMTRVIERLNREIWRPRKEGMFSFLQKKSGECSCPGIVDYANFIFIRFDM